MRLSQWACQMNRYYSCKLLRVSPNIVDISPRGPPEKTSLESGASPCKNVSDNGLFLSAIHMRIALSSSTFFTIVCNLHAVGRALIGIGYGRVGQIQGEPITVSPCRVWIVSTGEYSKARCSQW